VLAKGSYQLQIASFRRRHEAEHLKASLHSREFSATIVLVINDKLLVSVMIARFHPVRRLKGPACFCSQSACDGMIAKMDA